MLAKAGAAAAGSRACRAGGPVQRGCQRSRVDPGIDNRDPWYLRSGGRVDVDLVTPADQAARKIGHKRLRAAALRLADG